MADSSFEPRFFYLIAADGPLSLEHSARRGSAPDPPTALDVLRDVAHRLGVSFTVSCVGPDGHRETWNATLPEAAATCTYADAAHEAIQGVADQEAECRETEEEESKWNCTCRL